jgi:hypothetical protein
VLRVRDAHDVLLRIHEIGRLWARTGSAKI